MSAFETFMPISVVNATTASNTGISVTVAVPGSVVDGDLLIAAIKTDNTGGSTLLAGWTALANDETTLSTRVMYRVANSEPADYTFTVGFSAVTGHMLALRGANTPNIGATVNGGFSTIIGPASVSISTTSSWACFVGASLNTAGFGAPDTLTEHTDVDGLTLCTIAPNTTGSVSYQRTAVGAQFNTAYLIHVPEAAIVAMLQPWRVDIRPNLSVVNLI